MVVNNVIYDVASYGYNGGSEDDNGYGIVIASGGGYKVYYNSISMNTNQTSTSGLPAAVNITSVVTAANSIDLRNNIFANSQTIGTQRYAIYCSASNAVFSSINNNDYYTTGANLGYLTVNVLDLAAWKTATGQDNKSISADPLYTTWLQLLPGTPCNGKAIALSAVTVDINGATRHFFKPTIGAYEYAPNNLWTWTGLAGGGDNSWTTNANWDKGTAPTLNDNAFVPADPASNPDVFPNVAAGITGNCADLYIQAGGSVTVQPTGTLNVKNAP
jgi:hypothetical protein